MTDPVHTDLDLEPAEDLEDPFDDNDPVPDAERDEPDFVDDEDDDYGVDADDEDDLEEF